MPIPFTCPHCGNQTTVADQYAGTSGPCASCGQTITIPETPFSLDPGAKPLGAPIKPASSSGSSSTMIVLIVLGVMCLCIGPGLLVALLLPAVQSARGAARRMQCSNNLKQIGLALHNYHDVHKCFPPAYIADKNGKPMHSWRVMILPYIEESALYDQYNFDEPWDSPNNMAVAAQMPDVFRCPSSPQIGTGNETNYVVVIGDSKKFPQTLFSPNKGISFGKVTDGTSNTIAVVETATPVPWTQPDADLNFSTMQFAINAGANSISSDHPGVANVLFADGSVRPLSKSVDSRTLRNLIQPADGNVIGPIP